MQALSGIFSLPSTTQVTPHINFKNHRTNLIHNAPKDCSFLVDKKKYRIIIEIDTGIRLK
jgi:hypothetical protein